MYVSVKAKMESSRGWDKTYPVNIPAAKAIVDGDGDIFRELLEIFLEHLPEQMGSLHSAITAEDGKNVRFFAHQIKGAMRNFAADEACDAAYRLEKAGKEQDFSKIDEYLSELRNETAVLKKYIEKKEWRKYF